MNPMLPTPRTPKGHIVTTTGCACHVMEECDQVTGQWFYEIRYCAAHAAATEAAFANTMARKSPGA